MAESRRESQQVEVVTVPAGAAPQVAHGGTGSDNTRTDPPPKYKNSHGAQERDIAAESGAPAEGAAEPSEQLGKSASVAGSVSAIARAMDAVAPCCLPPGTERIASGVHAKWYRARLREVPITVVLEVEEIGGQLWAHLTVSGRGRAPSHAEICWCKDVFLRDRRALRVYPERAQVPRDGFAAHLYAPLGRDPLPRFDTARAHTLEVCS